MRSLIWLGCGVAALCLAASSGSVPRTKPGSTSSMDSGSAVVASDGSIETVGRTQCLPGRRANIAPVPLHPVVEVVVAPGEHVKKGQILVKLDQAQAHAAIDGVVSWLDVYPSQASRPGTSAWGEIVDARELDVKCELTPQQADEVALGQPVDVRVAQKEGPASIGRLIFIAPVAEQKSGLVPMLVRLHNSDGRFRSGVAVSVRFPPVQAAYKR